VYIPNFTHYFLSQIIKIVLLEVQNILYIFSKKYWIELTSILIVKRNILETNLRFLSKVVNCRIPALLF